METSSRNLEFGINQPFSARQNIVFGREFRDFDDVTVATCRNRIFTCVSGIRSLIFVGSIAPIKRFDAKQNEERLGEHTPMQFFPSAD
jgi:hypothetical protein